MRLVRNLTYLRIYNILENDITPVKRHFNTFNEQLENVYKSFTINEATIDGENKGKKVIGFMDRSLNREEQEAIYSKEMDEYNKGNLVRYKVINVKLLREIRPNWYVTVINKERDSSELSKAMFTEKIAQAASIMQLTGKQLNGDAVVESFERTWQDRNLFQKSPVDEASMIGGDQAGQLMSQIQSMKTGSNEMVNKGLTQGVTEGPEQETLKPSVNTMLNAAE
jgi:3-phenylpropionate/cinnamic acid dioxygenase small subunit